MCAGVSGLRLTGLWGFRSGKHVHLEQRKMRFLASFHACSWIFGCWPNGWWCPWSVVCFCFTLLPWLLCFPLGLVCYWVLELLVVFEQTCRDAFGLPVGWTSPHLCALGLSSVMQAALPLWCFLNTLARFFPKVVLLLITIVINVMAELTKPKKNSRFHWDVTKLHLLISVNYCEK